MLKVAFASSDRKPVDQHFGAARAFAIHAIDAGPNSLVEVAEFIETAMDGHEGKLAAQDRPARRLRRRVLPGGRRSAIQQLLARGRAAGEGWTKAPPSTAWSAPCRPS